MKNWQNAIEIDVSTHLQAFRLFLRRIRSDLGGAVLFIDSLFVFWLTSGAFGQEFHVQNWHTDEGLPDGEITAIQQTPDGYLWVGTPKGLARFDGIRFEVLKAGSASLPANSQIASLLTSRDGTLWVSTEDGTVAKRVDGRFENVQLPQEHLIPREQKRSIGSWLWDRRLNLMESVDGMHDNGLFGSHNHLIEDYEGSIWWDISDRLVMVFKSNHWRMMTPTNGLPATGVRQLATDHEGHIWAESSGKLNCYVNDGWDSQQQTLSLSGALPVITPANQGGLWVAEPNGSWFHDGARVLRFADGKWLNGPGTISTTPLTSRALITCLIEDHTGRIWYGTAAGGVFFSGADGNWHRLQPQGSFSQGYISCLFEDRQGGIWIGTVGDGLYRITPQPVTMFFLPHPLDNAEANSTFVARDGAIWIGTGGAGMLRWYNKETYTIYGKPEGLDNLHVCTVFEDSQTNVWAGTSDGLFRLEAGRFVRVSGPAELSTWVKAIFEDKIGRLWIGTDRGLICFKNDQFTVYYLRSDRGYCDIRSIVDDTAGDLWIGTIGQGLFQLPGNNPNNLHQAQKYPSMDARALFSDSDGTLWIGSWGGGLIRKQGDQYTVFSSEDGIPSDRIQSIIADAKGRLWLSTDNGIVGIEPQMLRNYQRKISPPLWCQHLSLADGMANRGCSGSGQPVCASMADGRICFPDYEGVALLDPHMVASKSLIPAVFVEAVLADGKELAPTQNQELQASSSVRRFEFDYAAPDLASAKNLRFRYKLEGLDHNWVESGIQNAAYYSQLRPGQYIFRIMVGGSDGSWHDAEQGVNLQVIPRLWERRWLQALVAIVFIILAGCGIAWTQRRKFQLQVERLEMQQAVENERRRIARDLHDELGARLTATALQGEFAIQDGEIPNNVKPKINLITQSVRKLIGTVDEVVWTTDPKNDSLSNLVTFFCDYVEQFLAPTGISYRLEMSQDLPNQPLTAQMRRNLLLAVKEALNNAVRHSGAKIVWFKILSESGNLNIIISDDGCGFDPGKARPGGNGLSNIQNRMNIIGGRAEIKSTIGNGTAVTLSVRLSE